MPTRFGKGLGPQQASDHQVKCNRGTLVESQEVYTSAGRRRASRASSGCWGRSAFSTSQSQRDQTSFDGGVRSSRAHARLVRIGVESGTSVLRRIRHSRRQSSAKKSGPSMRMAARKALAPAAASNKRAAVSNFWESCACLDAKPQKMSLPTHRSIELQHKKRKHPWREWVER